MNWREREKLQLREKLATSTYELDGALYWTSVLPERRPVPMDVFKDADVAPPAAQQRAVTKYQDAFLADYKRRMANHRPDAEEMFEMRAAFGRGTTVVNIVTGRRTRIT